MGGCNPHIEYFQNTFREEYNGFIVKIIFVYESDGQCIEVDRRLSLFFYEEFLFPVERVRGYGCAWNVPLCWGKLGLL